MVYLTRDEMLSGIGQLLTVKRQGQEKEKCSYPVASMVLRGYLMGLARRKWPCALITFDVFRNYVP